MDIEEAIQNLRYFLIDFKKQHRDSMLGDKEIEAVKTILQEFEIYKRYFDCNVSINKYENYVSKDKIRKLITTKFKAVFEGDVEFKDGEERMDIVKYVKVDDIEKLLEGEKE